MFMGEKIPVVSFLCGALARRKHPPAESVPVKEDSDSGPSPQSQGGESSPDLQQPPPPADQEELQNQPLPPPPGRMQPQHTRTASYHQQNMPRSSSTGFRRVRSSLSMRMLTSSASRREDGEKKKNKALGHEDSVWKKAIILGEKCRVPDEDDDTVLYDEKGKRISTYHPKNPGQMGTSFSRQNSGIDQDSVSGPLRLGS